MKKFISFSALILLTVPAVAQDGYYIKAGGGTGVSSSTFSVFSGDAYNSSNNIRSNQAQVSIGYNKGNLQLETGIGYLRTGVTFVNAIGEPLCGGMVPPVQTPTSKDSGAVHGTTNVIGVRYTISNTHIVVPVMIGYVMKMGKKVDVVPGIGVETLLNFKGKLSADQPASQDVENSINYHYNPVAAMLALKIDVQYHISKQWGVWVSPSAHNMLSSLTTAVPGDAMSRQYYHALLFSAGVRYNLPAKVKTTVN